MKKAFACAITTLFVFQTLVAQTSGQLRITILEGDEAIVNVRQRVAREAIVQVEDENRKPVAGAALLLLSPERGPTSLFANGTNSLTLTTDAQGRAIIRGLRPNTSAGRYEIQITAQKDGLTGRTNLVRTNVVPKMIAGMSAQTFTWVMVAAAAAAAGTAIGVNQGGGSNRTVITPGTVTVGQPR